jgi:hypothetical protein
VDGQRPSKVGSGMISVQRIENIVHEELSEAEMFTWNTFPSEADLAVCHKIAMRIRDEMESS